MKKQNMVAASKIREYLIRGPMETYLEMKAEDLSYASQVMAAGTSGIETDNPELTHVATVLYDIDQQPVNPFGDDIEQFVFRHRPPELTPEELKQFIDGHYREFGFELEPRGISYVRGDERISAHANFCVSKPELIVTVTDWTEVFRQQAEYDKKHPL